MNVKYMINPEKLPQHVAVIMDGNGRWAREKNQQRVFGHENGVIAVRETAEIAAEIGIKYLTLYTFSIENWKRPKEEVDALMDLLVKTIHAETETLNRNKIKLEAIGNLLALKPETYNELQNAIKNTASNNQMTLILALSYSSHWEITEAAKRIALEVKKNKLSLEEITSDIFASRLSTSNIPDPELLIRTSGEYRLSNFLLWQLAYTELYFTPTLWPDFRKKHFIEAIIDFQKRERRFGMISEQIC